jgi:UDP-N-acetylmuramate--alanine ligase
MHIFFSGIGGAGIGPLALIAKQAGFEVSGSDKKESQYTEYLKKHGINLYIGQTEQNISKIQTTKQIDWFVYSSALPFENPNHPELIFVKENNIKHSKRDEFLSFFLNEKNLKLIAIAGTHGKTTTTAMAIWAFKQLNIPLSYAVGAKLSFGEMGNFDKNSKYFVYECDEFDRNFLSFQPEISLITSVDWDHREIYPSRQNYIEAFNQFIDQSETIYIHQKDYDYLKPSKDNIFVIADSIVDNVSLDGLHNRQNASLVIQSLANITGKSLLELTKILSEFPGSNRRFEQIITGLYSDYAHTPEEISATIQLAKEISNKIVVIYEPLTNRRQHYAKYKYKEVFVGIDKLYWLPSYQAREDDNLEILQPEYLISLLDSSLDASPQIMSPDLKNIIEKHILSGDTVVCLAGGGGGSLDEWIRKQF